MGINKNLQDSKRYRSNDRSKKAYKPKIPYRSVEGIESLAWDMLSPYAVWLIMELYRKFNGYNRSDLRLSYAETNDKISTGTFSKYIWELIGYGFIDVARWGTLERNNSIYALSDRWRKFGDNEKKLNKIKRLLSHLDKVKRTKTPADFSSKEKSAFRLKRKQKIWKIHKMILGA